jgi:hypothetical protein
VLDRAPGIEWRGAVDKTPSRRPLVNIYIYRKNGQGIGKQLLEEVFGREWSPHHRND